MSRCWHAWPEAWGSANRRVRACWAAMHRRSRWALGWALAIASLSAATPAQAQVAGIGKPAFDSREGGRTVPAAPTNAAALQARDRLSARLGREGVLDLDDRTGTPRLVARLDGFLTGPSG